MMRAFVAIGMPDAAKAALAGLQRHVPAGRPVPADNLHLTLAFLGEQEEARLADLHHRLAALERPAFALRLAGLGCFGGRRPRALYIAAEPCPGLIGLHEAVLGCLRRSGIAPERRRYRPHVTLARFGSGADRRATARLRGFLEARPGAALPPFTVHGFGLWRSLLRPEGAEYELLAAYPLRGGGEDGEANRDEDGGHA